MLLSKLRKGELVATETPTEQETMIANSIVQKKKTDQTIHLRFVTTFLRLKHVEKIPWGFNFLVFETVVSTN